jgi:hypothetical protein
MANPLAIAKRNDLPTTRCNIHVLNSINPVLNPSTDTILCVLLMMPVASATTERSLSVVRCMKTYARSTMKNDRLSSLGLLHIPRDFEHEGQILNKFKKFLSISH